MSLLRECDIPNYHRATLTEPPHRPGRTASSKAYGRLKGGLECWWWLGSCTERPSGAAGALGDTPGTGNDDFVIY